VALSDPETKRHIRIAAEAEVAVYDPPLADPDPGE
jgi:hypothetical protein